MEDETPAFEGARFRHPWRDYQGRVLSELEDHITDGHLHVVAAPGSGKTVLGLEVMRRLGKPALILAPTLTIRHQWVDRFLQLFMEDGAEYPEWISMDLWSPGRMTVATYQALHSAFSADDIPDSLHETDDEDTEPAEDPPSAARDADELITRLRGAGVRTLVLDEAHHLRKEWWRVLDKLKDGLDRPTVVSLTATPPYDVERSQWDRYLDLCGPIDAEISVPELVRRGDLCPHQDYIHYSVPTEEERQTLSAFWDTVGGVAEGLLADVQFLDEVQASPWIADTEENLELVLNDPEFFTSLLVLLKAAGRSLPSGARSLLGVGGRDVPEFDAGWLEKLLRGILFVYRDHFPDSAVNLESIERSLKRAGVIERRNVIVEDAKARQKILARSVAKLNSIRDIVIHEADTLGSDLRMVILADYIRRETMPRSAEDLEPIRSLGVVPIFEYLRRTGIPGISLGILTGSLSLIPRAAGHRLEAFAVERGLAPEALRLTPARHDPGFLSLEIVGAERARMVQLVTDLFREGHISVLVGTQALLGEGWDAPSVNTLVLSSQVGSFMLSNQMRGRAMRVNPDEPSKTANIWHLATIDITPLPARLGRRVGEALPTGRTAEAKFEMTFRSYGDDCRTLLRRFRAFESVSLSQPPVITNQLHMLGLAPDSFGPAGVDRFNGAILDSARARGQLARRWDMALRGESDLPELRVKTETNYAPRRFALVDTLEALVKQSVFAGLAVFGLIMESQARSGGEHLFLAMIFAGVAGMLFAAPGLLKAGYLALRNGSLEGSLVQVTKALVATLHEMDAIGTHPDNIRIGAKRLPNGMAACDVHGVSTPDRQLILDALEELLQPVDNPRYLLIRGSKLGNLIRRDYHAVPSIIGQKKDYVESLGRFWRRYVGKAATVYTRNREGRLLLLKARSSALSSAFRRKVDRLTVWQ